jgi:hypothetical protein
MKEVGDTFLELCFKSKNDFRVLWVRVGIVLCRVEKMCV